MCMRAHTHVRARSSERETPVRVPKYELLIQTEKGLSGQQGMDEDGQQTWVMQRASHIVLFTRDIDYFFSRVIWYARW